MNNPWCESCSSKNVCYTSITKPKCYTPITNIGDIRNNEILEKLPSADRPQGEWKPKNHHTDYCSNCGFEETQWRTADYNFCPSCGAKMKGAE